jgi:Spy/CpxP family protein refolding chaperone
MRNRFFSVSCALVLFATAALSQPVQQPAQQPAPGPEAMRPGDGDPIRQLNLTPEQREQIRAIREHNQNERAVTMQKLREANRALEQALNAENPDEAVVEQRLKDVAEAQASQNRLRVLTEIRIRRVLTAEQRVLLRSLQQQARENRRQRMLPDTDENMQRRDERMRRAEERRNGVNQLQRRRDNQNRIP